MEQAQNRLQRRALVLTVLKLRDLLPDMVTFALGLLPCPEDHIT